MQMPVRYSRLGNPTVMAVEDKIAKTEGVFISENLRERGID